MGWKLETRIRLWVMGVGKDISLEHHGDIPMEIRMLQNLLDLLIMDINSISKGTNANMVPGTVDDEDDEWNLMGNPYIGLKHS
jgi:hypothetical protein